MSLFITFEGPDGSGKSTLIKKISDYLLDKNIDFIETREPGGTDISEKIRDLLLDKSNKEMSSRAEALLYAASRAQHVDELIRPSLENGKIVLSDRFVLSSLAYQGAGRALGIDKIQEINDFATDSINPDIIFFLKINPETTLNRKRAMDTVDRLEMEAVSFHEKVYQGYLEILEKFKDSDNLHIIDATQSKDKVYEDVIKILNRYLQEV